MRVPAVLAAVAVALAAGALAVLLRDPGRYGGAERGPAPAPPPPAAEREVVSPDAPDAVPPPRAARGAERAEAGRPEPEEARLRVRVVSTVDGAPLSGVQLELSAHVGGGEAPPGTWGALRASDGNGELELRVPAGQALRFSVEAATDHGPAEAVVDPLPPGGEATATLHVPTPGDAVWTGRVVREGSPVEGALVELMPPDREMREVEQSAETDGAGLVRFVTSSWIHHLVRARGLESGIAWDFVEPSFDPGGIQEIRLLPTGELHVRVLDGAGAPREGMVVTALSREDPWPISFPLARETTDASGWARATHVLAARFELRISRGGFVYVEDDDQPPLREDEERELEFALATGAIEGRATSAEGEPLAGRTLVLLPPELEAAAGASSEVELESLARAGIQVDATGSFGFDEVKLGEWLVALQPQPGALHVAPPRLAAVTSESPRAWVDLVALPHVPLAGRVVDERGDGVAGARVRVEIAGSASSPAATTDADGTFRFEALPAADLVLEVVPPAPFARRHGIPVEGGDEEIRIVLAHGSRVSGRVLYARTGVPVEAEVSAFELEGDGGTPAIGRVETSEGRFSFGGLAPGEYALLASSSAGASKRMGTARVRVPAEGEAVELDVRIARAGNLVAVSARELGPADLRVVHSGATVARLRLEPLERVTVEVPPGTVRLLVDAEGAEPFEEECSVLPGEHPFVPLAPKRE